MKAKKISLASIQGKLSRSEMKEIMAGSKKVCYQCAGYSPYCCNYSSNCCYDKYGKCCNQ
jgi:hypothetical protein